VVALKLVVVPASLVGLTALAGEVSEPAAYLSLFVSGAGWIFLVALLVMVVRAALARRALRWLVLALTLTVAGELESSRVVLGVPYWVRHHAQPAVRTLDDWKREHGQFPQGSNLDQDFPAPLTTALREAGCQLYVPDRASYRLTCRGVLFTHCTYEYETGRWSSWN
jgi:hypothetical protein